MTAVDISGLDKAAVLAALHNHAKSMFTGLVACDATASDDLTLEEAQHLTEGKSKFTYVDGRALLVDLSGDHFNPEFYDLFNDEEGLAERAIDRLRKTGAIMPWKPERPLETSAGLCYQSAEEIIESASDRVAKAMEETREAYNRGQLG